MLTRTFFSRAPLAPGRFAPLPASAVTAGGAMRDNLIALRGGLLSANKVSMAAENANGHSDGGAILDFYTALCTRFEKYL